MRTVKAVRVVQAAEVIHFVVPAELRADNDARIMRELWIRLNPIENRAYRQVCGFNSAQIFLIAVVAHFV